MKPDIHPEYRKVLFHDTSSDTFFLVGSTAQTTQTKEYEGQTYPYMTIDVSSASHPFTLGSRNQRKAMVAWPDSTSATTAAPAAEISFSLKALIGAQVSQHIYRARPEPGCP